MDAIYLLDEIKEFIRWTRSPGSVRLRRCTLMLYSSVKHDVLFPDLLNPCSYAHLCLIDVLQCYHRPFGYKAWLPNQVSLTK